MAEMGPHAQTSFAVNWEVELPSWDTVPLVLQGITARHSTEDAWQLLHHDRPRLYEEATFKLRGLLQPGLTIQAEIRRMNVRVAVRFEVVEKRSITYEHVTTSNLWSSEENHTHFFTRDTGLLPYEFYQGDQRMLCYLASPKRDLESAPIRFWP
jgi:hypothetical protein